MATRKQVTRTAAHELQKRGKQKLARATAKLGVRSAAQVSKVFLTLGTLSGELNAISETAERFTKEMWPKLEKLADNADEEKANKLLKSVQDAVKLASTIDMKHMQQLFNRLRDLTKDFEKIQE